MTLSSHRFHYIAALTLMASALAAVTGCHNVTPAVKSSANNAVAVHSIPVDVMKDYISGDYASAGYENRSQGYDWVGVMVRSAGNEQIDIKVRARSDIKKPTCQFDGTASLMGQDKAHGVIFQTKVNDSTAFFQLFSLYSIKRAFVQMINSGRSEREKQPFYSMMLQPERP